MLKPHGISALLTCENGKDSFPDRQQALGIIRGDAVPQCFIAKLIDLYLAGKLPFARVVRLHDFGEINKVIADAKRGDTIKPVLQISEV